jgi:hypothetical protein
MGSNYNTDFVRILNFEILAVKIPLFTHQFGLLRYYFDIFWNVLPPVFLCLCCSAGSPSAFCLSGDFVLMSAGDFFAGDFFAGDFFSGDFAIVTGELLSGAIAVVGMMLPPVSLFDCFFGFSAGPEACISVPAAAKNKEWKVIPFG